MTPLILVLSLALSIPLEPTLLPPLTPHIPQAALLPHPIRLLLLSLALYLPLSYAYDFYRRPANPKGYKIVRYSDLSGPKATSLLWGLEKALYDDSPPGRLLEEWSAKYGGVYRFRGVLGAKNITLTLPTALHHVLTTAVYTYPKPLGGRLWLGTLLGEGVLVSEGPRHARQRKQLARAFTPQALRGQHEVFERLTAQVVDAWRALLSRSEAVGRGEETIDVQYWSNRLSLDAIGLAGFAYSFGSVDQASDEAVEGVGSGGEKQQHPLARTFDKLTDSSGTYAAFVLRALLFVWPGVVKMPSQRMKSIGEVRKSLGAEVKRVRQESGTLEGKTVIGILEKQAADEGSGIDDEEIEAQIMTLVFAGYETTSTAIAWALYELALHPTTQSALRTQLRSSPAGETPPFLEAVIRETLRLHPPVLDLHRQAEKDDLVPLGDGRALWVEKGTVVYVPLNVLGNQGKEGPWNPAQWLKPSPSSTADNPPPTPTPGEAAAKPSSTAQTRDTLWAFSDGPRVCIGRAFALSEIRTVLSALVREFEFRPDAGLEVEPFYSFVVRPRVRGERGSRLPLVVRRAGA